MKINFSNNSYTIISSANKSNATVYFNNTLILDSYKAVVAFKINKTQYMLAALKNFYDGVTPNSEYYKNKEFFYNKLFLIDFKKNRVECLLDNEFLFLSKKNKEEEYSLEYINLKLTSAVFIEKQINRDNLKFLDINNKKIYKIKDTALINILPEDFKLYLNTSNKSIKASSYEFFRILQEKKFYLCEDKNNKVGIYFETSKKFVKLNDFTDNFYFTNWHKYSKDKKYIYIIFTNQKNILSLYRVSNENIQQIGLDISYSKFKSMALNLNSNGFLKGNSDYFSVYLNDAENNIYQTIFNVDGKRVLPILRDNEKYTFLVETSTGILKNGRILDNSTLEKKSILVYKSFKTSKRNTQNLAYIYDLNYNVTASFKNTKKILIKKNLVSIKEANDSVKVYYHTNNKCYLIKKNISNLHTLFSYGDVKYLFYSHKKSENAFTSIAEVSKQLVDNDLFEKENSKVISFKINDTNIKDFIHIYSIFSNTNPYFIGEYTKRNKTKQALINIATKKAILADCDYIETGGILTSSSKYIAAIANKNDDYFSIYDFTGKKLINVKIDTNRQYIIDAIKIIKKEHPLHNSTILTDFSDSREIIYLRKLFIDEISYDHNNNDLKVLKFIYNSFKRESISLLEKKGFDRLKKYPELLVKIVSFSRSQRLEKIANDIVI